MEDTAVFRDALADNLFSVPHDNDDEDNWYWGESERIRNQEEDGGMDGATELYSRGRQQRTVTPAPVLAPEMDLDGLRKELATFDLEGLQCSLAKERMGAAKFDALLRLNADGGGCRSRRG